MQFNAGQIVYGIDGKAYRVSSTLKIAGESAFKLADLQGRPCPTPANFFPIDGTRMRFASILKFVFAFNKDLTRIINSLIEQAGLPTDPLMDWAAWFQKVYGSILASVTPNFDIQDEVMYQTVVKLLLERRSKNGKTLLENFKEKIEQFHENVQQMPLERQVSEYLKKTFEFYGRRHAKNDALELIRPLEISTEQAIHDDEGEKFNLLDTKEHATGTEAFEQPEAYRDIKQFIDQFEEWLKTKETPKSAPNYATLLEIFWEQAQQSESGDVKISDLTQEWIHRTGLSFDSLKQYRDKLGTLIRDFVYDYKSDLGNAYKFVDLVKHIFPAPKKTQKPKAMPAKASSKKAMFKAACISSEYCPQCGWDAERCKCPNKEELLDGLTRGDHLASEHHWRQQCRKCGNVQTCRCSTPKTTFYVNSCHSCHMAAISEGGNVYCRICKENHAAPVCENKTGTAAKQAMNAPQLSPEALDRMYRIQLEGLAQGNCEGTGMEDCDCQTCEAREELERLTRKQAAAKPKCPHCGSDDYGLMPTDFETAKCNKCGKNWEHGIVEGINDPKSAAIVVEQGVHPSQSEDHKTAAPQTDIDIHPPANERADYCDGCDRIKANCICDGCTCPENKHAALDPDDEYYGYKCAVCDEENFARTPGGQLVCMTCHPPKRSKEAGIINPRPAMRRKEERDTHKKLEQHYKLMSEYIAQGMSKEEASRKAFEEITGKKNAAKPRYTKPGERVVLAEDWYIYVVDEKTNLMSSYDTEMWYEWGNIPNAFGEDLSKPQPTVSVMIPHAKFHSSSPVKNEDGTQMTLQQFFEAGNAEGFEKEGMIGHDFVDADQQAIRPDITLGDTGRPPHGRTQGSENSKCNCGITPWDSGIHKEWCNVLQHPQEEHDLTASKIATSVKVLPCCGSVTDHHKKDCPKQDEVWNETLGKLYPDKVPPKKADYSPAYPKAVAASQWRVTVRDPKGKERQEQVGGEDYNSAERAATKKIKENERVVSVTVASKTAAAPAAAAPAKAPAPAPVPAAPQTVVAPPLGTPVALPPQEEEDRMRKTVPPELPGKKWHMSALKTENNSMQVQAEIEQLIATHPLTEIHENVNPAFEHGQWWVICGPCGAIWSVVDAEGGQSYNGLDLEEVDTGDESCQENFNERADKTSTVLPIPSSYATKAKEVAPSREEIEHKLSACGTCSKEASTEKKAWTEDEEETSEVQDRLEYLRGELRAERISYEELAELQGLADYIDPGDVELLEAAGVEEVIPQPDVPIETPEFGEADKTRLRGLGVIGKKKKAFEPDANSGIRGSNDGTYIYQADVWCPTCAKEIADSIIAEGKAPADPSDEHSYDSDNFPKGPFFDEESDSPEHCAGCHIFLENPLTTHGEEYMREMVDQAIEKGRGEEPHIKEWMDFYGYHPDKEEAEEDIETEVEAEHEPNPNQMNIPFQSSETKEVTMKNKQAAEPTSGHREGRYVIVNYRKGGIILKPTATLAKEVADDATGEFAHNVELDDIWEMMEDFFTNGWEKVAPEDIGALTDGEIFSDPDGNIYWHERYQIESMTDELKAGNNVFMQYGGNLFDEQRGEVIAEHQGSTKEATGEMSQSEADNRKEWPLHHAIADALGGKVKAFDQYQGPYVLIGSEIRGQGVYAPTTPMKGTVRLWIQMAEDETGVQVYNEENEKLSDEVMWDDTEGVVDAARSVLSGEASEVEGRHPLAQPGAKEKESAVEKTAMPPKPGVEVKDKHGWTGRLQSTYDHDFEQFKGYDEVYQIAKRLGFATAEEAWEANPKVYGSVYPEDLHVVGAKEAAIPEPGGASEYDNHPLIGMLWDYLKRDPGNKDRVRTAWGTKTKQGLVLSVARVIKESPISGKESSKTK